MTRWMQPLAMLVAWTLALTHAMPLASAARYMRTDAVGERGGPQSDMHRDRAWVWGPAGADPIDTLGREALQTLARRRISPAYEHGRAADLFGVGARPVEELVELAAIGFQRRRPGKSLSDEQRDALARRLTRLQTRGQQIASWILLPRPNTPGRVSADNVVRFVTISDDTGTPALVSPGELVDGNVTHHALTAYGGMHRYPGWRSVSHEAFGARSAYLSQEMLEAILDDGVFTALSALPATEFEERLKNIRGAEDVLRQVRFGELQVSEAVEILTQRGAGKELADTAVKAELARRNRVQDVLDAVQVSLDDDVARAALATFGLGTEAAEQALGDAREGLAVATLKLTHEAFDVAVRGRHEDEPQDIQDRVNALITKVFTRITTADEKQRAEALKVRQDAARKEADASRKRVQIVPYLVDLGQFFEGNRPPAYVRTMIEARLEEAARQGRITDSRVKPLGHLAMLEVHYNGPQRSASVDRVITDLVTDVIAAEVGARAQNPQDTLVLGNSAVADAQEVLSAWQALNALLAQSPDAFRELVRKARSPYYTFDPDYVDVLHNSGLVTDQRLSDTVRNVVLSATPDLQVFEPTEQMRLMAGLPTVKEAPIGVTQAAQNLAAASYEDRLLRLFKGPTGNFAFNHGGSEPVGVSVALGGSPAAFNWPVMRLLDEAVQNQLKIEGIRKNELDSLRAADHAKDRNMLQRIAELEKELREIQTMRPQTELLKADLDQAQADAQRLTALKDKAEELEAALEKLGQELAKETETEGPGYVVVIESVADILAGKRDRRSYRFAYPRSAPYIHTLVDDQTEWAITKVLPRPGSRRYNINKSPADQDPMLQVLVDPIAGAPANGESLNPVLVMLQQSGFPALGELAAAVSQFYLTVSGSGEGTRHVGAIPVTAEEADNGAFADQGLVRLVTDIYMSYGTTRATDRPGLIPHAEVHDQINKTSDIKATREEKLWVSDELAMMGSFQPAVTAPEAQRRAEAAMHALGNRYHEIPAIIVRGPDGQPKLRPDGKPEVKLDPILEGSNRNAAVTVSDLKADIGATGHQSPYALQYAAFRASFNVAKRRGLIEDYQLTKGTGVIQNYDLGNAGDDNHFVLFHHRGADDPEVHALAFTTFFRAGWLIHQLGYQLYGDMQDFVTPEVQQVIRQRKLHLYAKLDDEFIEALKEELKWMPEAGRWNQVLEGYQTAREGLSTGREVELRSPGNVTGMGIGFAEKAFSRVEIEKFGYASIVGNDKAAGGAFNYAIYWALRLSVLMKRVYVDKTLARDDVRAVLTTEVAQKVPNLSARQQREMVDRLLEAANDLRQDDAATYADHIQNGVVAELMEVMPGSRAFLEVELEDEHLLSLMSAQNEHNIKRLWVKKRRGWINDLTADELAAIQRRVEQELSENRVVFQERKDQLKSEVAGKKRTLGMLNPWERMLHDQDIEAVIAAVRPRVEEIYKVRMFIGDDYLASLSVEKLAAVTHGQYVGKDDSVMVGIEPFMTLYRGVAKRFVRVNVGNARGSQWVAIRPERSPVSGGISKEAVAVQWSNPIEIAYRYGLKPDGTVEVDAKTGLARREDMYGGQEFDAIRTKTSQFNMIWIQTQGGFTPHGPNVKRDVEAAYPAAQTLASLVRPDSPFAVPVDNVTLSTLKQGAVAKHYRDAVDYAVSPDVAAHGVGPQAAWLAVHWSAYDLMDTAVAQERIQAQLDALGAADGLPLVLVVDGVTDVADAEAKAAQMFASLPEASGGKNYLTRERFTLVMPGMISEGDFLGRLEAAKPGSRLGAVVGPKEWAQTLKNASPDPQSVAAVILDTEDETASGSRALITAVEAAAAGGRLNQDIAAKLDVADDDGFFVLQGRALEAEVAVGVRAQRERMRSVRGVQTQE